LKNLLLSSIPTTASRSLTLSFPYIPLSLPLFRFIRCTW
jgi:hypothetical protein